ncbi:PAS domain S-box protein, partial [candidate division WOR-3 bacterium]|nr:PAS domain S-box protein [candidate division WOR-3 bacterium]
MIKQFGKKKNIEKNSLQINTTHIEHLNNLIQMEKMDEKTLANWLRELVNEFGGDEGAIFLTNSENLICSITAGTISLVEGRKISMKTGLGGWLLQSRKPAFLPQADKDIRFDIKDNIFDPPPISIVASPILFRDETYGIIQINRRKSEYPFNEKDAENLFDISKIFGFFLFFSDVKKKEKEKEKIKVEDKLTFSTVTQSVPIGFFIINKNSRILFVNNFALNILGLKIDEAIGKECRNIIISNDKKVDNSLLDGLLSKFPKKNYFQSPLHLLRKDGHEVTVSFGVSPFNYEKKEFAVIYFTNPAEWEMVYSKEDEFITSVAHELRTPLFAILGSLSILDTELERIDNLPPTIKSFLNIVREEGEKFTNILNALLDFDEVSKWNIGLKREPILILDLVKKISEDFEQRCKENNLLLEVDFPSEPIQIFGDKLALQYSFSHILDNAIKFNKPGGKVFITTEGLVLRDSNWNFEIIIKDTGIGISESELPFIFEKFYRVEKKIHTISGFGLGLTIVKDIIEMH